MFYKKILIFGSVFVLLFFSYANVVVSQTTTNYIFFDNFDDKADGEMSCSLTGGACAAPTGYARMYGDPENAPAQGATQITAAANNNNKVAGATKRGFRINLPDKVFPDQESKLTTQTWSRAYGKIYIQWDMFESRAWPSTSYQKLFRIPATSQTVIPEWQGRNFEIGFSPFGGNEGVDHLTWSNCRLGVEISTGAWHTYEIMLDMPNRRAELWVDGTSYGAKSASGINTAWTFSSFEIGGNQHTDPDNPGVGEYRNYDNVKVSETYIGISGSNPSAYCGDGSCNGTETCSSCQADCGTCPDTTAPRVTAFSASPTTLTVGSNITASYTVTDNVALARAELWYATFNSSNCNDSTKTGCVWNQLVSNNISGTSRSGAIPYTPQTAGTYWLGLHAVDAAGNVGYEPAPVKVTVNSPSQTCQNCCTTAQTCPTAFTTVGSCTRCCSSVCQNISTDTTAPRVTAFSVTPTTLTVGSNITASYTVTDNSSLARAELWRAPSGINCTDTVKTGCNWGTVPVAQTAISGTSRSSTLSNTPATAGIYYYGLHVVDSAGNIGYEPAPVKVTVNTSSLACQNCCTTAQTCPTAFTTIGSCTRCCATACQNTTTCTDNDGDRHITQNNSNFAACGNICGPSHNQSCLGYNDCNDNNATVYFGAAEICGNGIDEDCSGADAACNQTECQKIDSSSPIPQGFGAPYNVLSAAREQLIKTECQTSSVQINIGNGSPAQVIWRNAYIWRNNAWQNINLNGNIPAYGGNWFKSRADASVPLSANELNNTNYLVAFICNWTGSQWKCGCRDSACITPYWQLQRFGNY